MSRLTALIAAMALGAAGCVTVSEGVGGWGEIPAESVLLVGKIEIVPPVTGEEQTYRAGWDVLNTRRHHIGRAILYMSDQPRYRDRTGDALNPPLEATYFLAVPRSRRFMVRGSVTMELVARAVSARQSVLDHTELLFPGPIEFDIRPADKAIYVGTLRLHRDEFREVTRAEVHDHFDAAYADFTRKFGPGLPLRTALLKPLRTDR
jgi:hypothetical protein